MVFAQPWECFGFLSSLAGYGNGKALQLRKESRK